jgi:large subunit ribosomal protein L17
MRHHNSNRKFGREAGPRKAMMKSLAKNLVEHKHIETTEAKAKELRPFIEKLVTKAKVGDLAATRNLVAVIGKDMTATLIKKIAPDYKSRTGGYTRIVKLPRRKSDAAKMAVIEFV